MSTINQIQLPNGSTYDFEDTVAREEASSKADKTLVTTSANGLMSKEDKAKLDGIDPSAITTNAANIKKNADAISAETTRAKAAEKANADTISAEVTRAKKAEEANTQLTNDLKTGLTSGTVRVAKATAADSASSLGKVSTYQTWIPDNGGRRKYLLMYDITDWISAKSNAPTRGFDGYFISRRGSGFVSNNCTGTLSMVASYNGMSGSTPIKSDDSQSLRLRTTSEMYKPVILHNTSTNKYYLALETYGSVRDLVLFGIFQGTFVGKWVQNVGQSFTPGTLPDGYELYSEGYVSMYSVATSSADGLMSKSDKAKLDGLSDSGIHYVPFKLVDDYTCSTTDSFDTVMSMIQSNKPVQASVNVDGKVIALPVFMYDAGEIMFRNDEMYIILATAETPGDIITLAMYGPTITDKLQDNDTTETSGQAALDAHMGKVLSDRINAVKTGAIDQIVKNTAQIETAGTATNAHSAGEYVMISNALYKVTASVAKGDTWTIGTNVTAANIGSEISSLKSDLANKLYPVGSIYMSVNATNPAELFGGTWERLKDRFLLAAGDSYAAGSTGGEAQHTLTVDEMPSHNHEMPLRCNWRNGTDGVENEWALDLSYETGDGVGTWPSNGGTGATGSNNPHNNMPPYLAVYMWKRTA